MQASFAVKRAAASTPSLYAFESRDEGLCTCTARSGGQHKCGNFSLLMWRAKLLGKYQKILPAVLATHRHAPPAGPQAS